MEKKDLKIALISSHSFSKPGGVQNHILGLQREFKKMDIQTKVIVPRRSWKENYGEEIILLGTSIPLYLAGNQVDLDINFNPLSIDQTLKKEKFSVLHFHNFVLPFSFQILASPFSRETLNILTIHANLEKMINQVSFQVYFGLCKIIIQWRIDGVIGVSPVALLGLEDFKKPKAIIPNGIELTEFHPKIPKIKKFCDKKINLLFVGRIEERKGLIYLLKAFKILSKKFSHLRLIVVGDGPERKKCEEFKNKNNLKDVYFEGEKTGKEIPSYYSTADIFIAPSIFGESFGIVLLEAMASGKPVVAFANEGYKAVLKNSKGERFLARPKDYHDLAKKIEVLIKNPKLREEMGRWGRREAEKYSWSKIAERVLDFYRLCQKYREKNKKLSFPRILEKIEKMAQKDLLKWSRKIFNFR